MRIESFLSTKADLYRVLASLAELTMSVTKDQHIIKDELMSRLLKVMNEIEIIATDKYVE